MAVSCTQSITEQLCSQQSFEKSLHSQLHERTESGNEFKVCHPTNEKEDSPTLVLIIATIFNPGKYKSTTQDRFQSKTRATPLLCAWREFCEGVNVQ